MIIEINDAKTLASVNEAFSEYYPFLGIAFFGSPHHWQESSSQKQRLPYDKKIGEIRKHHLPGVIEIHSWQKTGTVEQEFRRRFGLNIQVLRRHGDSWVQTAGTDELTLEEQNEIGRNATQEMLHGTDRKSEQGKPL